MHTSRPWRPKAPLDLTPPSTAPANLLGPLSTGNPPTLLDAQQEEQWEDEGGALALPPLRSPATDTSGWRDDGYWMTGSILSLRAGGFGFIASDSHARPWALRFHARAVTHDQFNQLQIGGRVRFRRETLPGDPSRVRAVLVAAIG
jgi:hypothetical protein